MKKLTRSLILSLTLLLSLTTIACNQETSSTQSSAPSTNQGQKIGVIDTVTIFQQSEPGKAAIAFLESLQEDAIARLKPLEEKLNVARESENEEEFKEIAAQMQSIAGEFQEALKVQQEVIYGTITQELTALIEKYRAEKQLTVIFNKTDLISYDPAQDISNDIMVAFNKISLDYQSIIESAFGSEPTE